MIRTPRSSVIIDSVTVRTRDGRRRSGHSRLSARARSCRGGLSLLEVMFAMGIIAVGLLGVLTILPVAGMRTTRGTVTDAADRLGRNAVREFDLRMMRQPNMWTRLNMVTSQYGPYPYQATPPVAPLERVCLESRSFCIDPLFIATPLATSVTDPTIAEAFPYYPPLNANAETRMKRISLRPYPNAMNSSGTLPEGMSLAQALQIFTSWDDLVFDLPKDDPLAVPVQNFGDPSDLTQSTRRQAMGKFSWLATLTPKQDLRMDQANHNTDQYILSIVVFHGRDMSMTIAKTNYETDGPDNERLLDVAGFDGSGYGGGEVRLETRTGRPVQDLALRTGDWVMLSAKVGTGTSSNPLHYFRWYRVLSAEDAVDGTGPWTRNVTLQGTDWDLPALLLTSGPVVTQATVLNNVVAVYEKTIRLETSSLWTGH